MHITGKTLLILLFLAWLIITSSSAKLNMKGMIGDLHQLEISYSLRFLRFRKICVFYYSRSRNWPAKVLQSFQIDNNRYVEKNKSIKTYKSISRYLEPLCKGNGKLLEKMEVRDSENGAHFGLVTVTKLVRAQQSL